MDFCESKSEDSNREDVHGTSAKLSGGFLLFELVCSPCNCLERRASLVVTKGAKLSE